MLMVVIATWKKRFSEQSVRSHSQIFALGWAEWSDKFVKTCDE